MPAKAKEAPAQDIAAPTPDEAEAAANDKPVQEESEVHADEFTRGTAVSDDRSALSKLVVEDLAKPLDPSRVRRRAGRGSGQFEYLAGHDVKRRANEIFGFGQWGSEVVELIEMASVPVVASNGKEGWHVGYSAVVRVTVRGCLPVSDVGYGDGVEYGPAAHVTARELAVKEAVTDGMKRALTQYGDQFGLILYAKQDEKQRIERERNAADTTAIRRNNEPGVPRTWAEVNKCADEYGADLGWPEWVKQAAMTLFGTDDSKALTTKQRSILLQKASGAIVALVEAHAAGTFPPPTRKEVADAWAKVIDGSVLDGPAWRMSPDEEERELYEPPATEETYA